MNRMSEKTKAKEITIHTIPRLAQYLRSLGGDYTQDASAGEVRFFSQLIYHHDYIVTILALRRIIYSVFVNRVVR